VSGEFGQGLIRKQAGVYGQGTAYDGLGVEFWGEDEVYDVF
jgi:hypothetical protein